jgi:hypothetical protein
MIKEAKKWERVGIESWLNYERNKKRKTNGWKVN